MRRAVWLALTLMAIGAYAGAAWASAGGDDTGIVVLIILLTACTIWTGRSTLRV